MGVLISWGGPRQKPASTIPHKNGAPEKTSSGTEGKVTIRYDGKLFHLGIGRAFKKQKILMVIADNHITTSLAATGEIITEHYIDTARDYQKPYWKKGDPPLNPK